MAIRKMCKSKIHRVTVTECDLDYEGSITIDAELLEAADILPYEQIMVANINNGQRFETYAIEGPRGSGVICVNGAAARLAAKGDLVIVISSTYLDEKDCLDYRPKVVNVDAKNRPRQVAEKR
ncbi:MAG: aspartate 1-decarboxylase [Candidatus Eisenbacteria sp.]|nr:aspartate 1-decarboxylase [Candidatus Eisenbacteria bacterium]